MSTFIFIISAILLHIPSGIYKDTIRRFKRMEEFNPDKAYSFQVTNGHPLDNSTLSGLALFSSIILALIPIFQALSINWILIIIINTLFSFLIAPVIAFIFYPKGVIYTNRRLKIKTFQHIGLAIILLIVAFSIK
ncbi:hypothetical protein ACFO3U_03135 [Flavobacterium ponti]|uniref:DUF3784 domain-containing protein n=1 Tax=Flavobacterium ponti TaxID=665133 RepID=A0ABV9P038_9FLAO